MISIFISLFLSFSWANNACDELFQASAENRARLLRGEISEVQFSRMQAELNERASRLNMKNGHAAFEKKAQSKKTVDIDLDTDFVPLRLKMVDHFSLLENNHRKIEEFSFDPSTGLSYLTIKSGKADYSDLYRGQSGIVEQDAYLDIKLKETALIPGSDEKMLVRRYEAYWELYDLRSKKQIRKIKTDARYLVVSPSGNIAYPRISIGNSVNFSIFETNKFVKRILKLNTKDGGNIALSPNEEYMILTTPRDIYFNKGGKHFLPALFYDGIKFRKTSMSSDLTKLFVLYADGSLNTFAMDDVLASTTHRINPAYVELPFGRDGMLIQDAKFNRDGRFLAAVYVNPIDHNRRIFSVWDSLTKLMVHQEELEMLKLDLGPRVSFADNGEYLTLHTQKEARVYRMGVENVEAIE